MEKRILFISEVMDSFLITALIKAMEEGGFEVICTQPHPKEISEMKNRPSISIVYLDNDATRYVSTLEWYADVLAADVTHSTYFYLIGNPAEIHTAFRSVPESLVSAVFKRPVNTTDLITQLDLACTGYDYEAERASSGIKPEGNDFSGDESKKKILLVDDDSTLLRSMQSILSKHYNVYITNSGMNTIAFLKEHKVDLILLDYEMPILSGQEVFQILKSEPPTADIPVIFLTSKDDKNIVMKVLALKPAAYLLKPISPALLIQTVEEFFTNQAKEKERKQKQITADSILETLEAVD